MLLKWICFLVAVASVASQLPYEAEPSAIEISIQQISKVMREDDPMGRNHSTKVIISPHTPFPNVVEWTLLLHTPAGMTESYSVKGDGSNPSTQTEFIFEGNLVETNSLVLQAKNESKTVAFAYMVISIIDLETNMAWVGADKSSSSPSLRVEAGEILGEVVIDRWVCKTMESPCYYLTSKPRVNAVKRCTNLYPETGDSVTLCDERITEFREITPTPPVHLRDDGRLEVEFTYNNERTVVEVVVYDPVDHSKVFSDPGFKCRFRLGAKYNTGDTMTCINDMTLPESQTEMMVLVVKLDDQGNVYESNLQFFNSDPEDPAANNTGVIVGAVFGTLLGLALVIFLIIFFMKKDQKKAATKKESSATYTATATAEPDP